VASVAAGQQLMHRQYYAYDKLAGAHARAHIVTHIITRAWTLDQVKRTGSLARVNVHAVTHVQLSLAVAVMV
jgi:hypothetical protein